MSAYGLVNIGGNQYIEKFFTYTSIVTVAANGFLQPRVVLDGDGGFMLKYLTVAYSQTATVNNLFRLRLGNSDGSQWYSSSGVVTGGTGNDRVNSLLLFGNGQFPFPVIPYILFLPNGSINLDIQDISGQSNTIEFAFHGSKLYDYTPANQTTSGN